ncbi:MAG: hypothetical protein Q4C46_06550 [Bacillota bacterium]|nr:hypothetical protein [Bacillota bacterium]
MKRTKTFKLSLGGICLALTIIFMSAGSFVPGIELTLFALSSIFTAVMILETGVGGGIILYAAAALLGFIIIPNKLALIPYVFLFGYYGILKYFIEKIPNAIVQVAVKAVFFAALLCLGLLGFRELLLGSIKLPDYPAAVLIIGGILMMLLYDYIFTMIINFYIRRFQNKGMDNMKLS